MFKYFYNLRGGRDEAPDAESVPLGAGEAEALVEERITEQVLAGLPHNLRLDTTCLPSPPHHHDGHLEELSPCHLAGDTPPLVHASTNTGAAGAQCFGLNRTVCTFLF